MKKRFEKQIKELTAQSQHGLVQVSAATGEGAQKIQSLT